MDASTEIGTGHVMRCLTLADALSERGMACHFLSRDLPGNLFYKVMERGHVLHRLAAPEGVPRFDPDGPPHAGWLGLDWRDDAADCAPILAALAPDWLVMDHYALESRWQKAVLPTGCKLFVIDDLADRQHVADILLDQNLGREVADYDRLVPANCTRLIGPRFALLRPEFAARRAESLARRADGALRRLLVSMGGVDRDNATGAVLEALARLDLPGGMEVTVILGRAAPWLDAVQEMAAKMPFACRVLVDRTDMADLLADADLAIGAAGSSTWERCCLGVPTLVLSIAQNQEGIAMALAHDGSAYFLGSVNSPTWRRRLSWFFESKQKNEFIASMSKKCASLCNGSSIDLIHETLLGL